MALAIFIQFIHLLRASITTQHAEHDGIGMVNFGPCAMSLHLVVVYGVQDALRHQNEPIHSSSIVIDSTKMPSDPMSPHQSDHHAVLLMESDLSAIILHLDVVFAPDQSATNPSHPNDI